MFNKDFLLYKIFGIVSLLVLVGYITLNIASYMAVQNFAKAHQVDEIKYGRFINNEYDTIYIKDTIAGARVSYAQSVVKFYRDGKDVVIEDVAYIEFNEMNEELINWYMSYVVSTSLILVFSLLGMLFNLRLRHFSHAHVFGAIAALLSIFAEISVILNPGFVILITLSLIASVYFYARTRFIDFDESKLTGIFKYRQLEANQNYA